VAHHDVGQGVGNAEEDDDLGREGVAVADVEGKVLFWLIFTHYHSCLYGLNARVFFL